VSRSRTEVKMVVETSSRRIMELDSSIEERVVRVMESRSTSAKFRRLILRLKATFDRVYGLSVRTVVDGTSA
jgi:hypothetical protein